MRILRRIIFDILFLFIGLIAGMALSNWLTLPELLNKLKDWIDQIIKLFSA